MNQLAEWIAYRLPRRIVYWCFIRLTAEVTTGALRERDMLDVNPPELLKAWDDAR